MKYLAILIMLCATAAFANTNATIEIREEHVPVRYEVPIPAAVEIHGRRYVREKPILPEQNTVAPALLQVQQNIKPQAVLIRPTSDGAGASIHVDPIRAFALDGHMTWQEGLTYIGGGIAALFVVGSQTDWFGLDDGSGGGVPPPNSSLPGNQVYFQGDNNQVNFQGSGSNGSGQQSGAESLTGASAGAGEAGNN